MSEPAPASSRQPAEAERQAFQRLGLTPGHWAALAPAPLFYRSGLRAPNRRFRSDLEMSERLRRSLWTVGGLSAEAGHFWDRLGDGKRVEEARLATRLLAWHLATDLSFARRTVFFQLLRLAADHFVARNTYPPRTHDAVQIFRWQVDAYLPFAEFVPNADPPWTPLSTPTAETLDAIADTVLSPLISGWPLINPLDAPRVLPTVVHVLGEPAREWWGQRDPARRAVERGLASLPFEERHQHCAAMYEEWYRTLVSSASWPNPDEFAQRFVTRVREWVDAVRFAGREITNEPPPLPVATPIVEVASPSLLPTAAPPPDPPRATSVPPEYIRIPPAASEPVVRELAPEPKPVAPPPATKPTLERVTVTVAEPFTMVTFSDALARAATIPVAEVCAWVDSQPQLLFDDGRDEAARQIAVVKAENPVPSVLWIVGDLHADILTLANIISHAESLATPAHPAHFIFLGDFVDRGIHDHEALLLLFRLMMDHPQRVCIIPGNHDIDLKFDESTSRFRVTIEPAEYCESLNASLRRDTPADRERVQLARAFIRFCAGRPKALFLPDGTLITHGGFPHTDAQKDISTLTDLCQPKCIDDFLWARIAESARVKRPNRGSRGHEFGWDTLVQFSRLATERLGLPVRRLIRGHDHVTDRWQEYPEYAENGVPVLTINAMGRLLDGEPTRRDGRQHPLPVVARWKPNYLPEVVVLPLDPAEVARAFLRPMQPADEAGTLAAKPDRPAEGGP